MNNRILLVVMTSALLSTSTGCGIFRNFLFGRGAQCGLCNRVAAPAQNLGPAAIPARPTCNTPTYIQPNTQPNYGAQPGCGCNPNPCGQPAHLDTCPGGTNYSYDPYSGGVVGSGTIVNESPIYGDNFQSRNYESYSPGYKVDNDGARILYEDPLPPNARAVN